MTTRKFGLRIVAAAADDDDNDDDDDDDNNNNNSEHMKALNFEMWFIYPVVKYMNYK